MPKVLYIEDQLTQNIASIRKFFAPLLKSSIKKKLTELEGTMRVYPQMIVEACSLCTDLDICYSFHSALDTLINHHQEYELIIIDRNLSEYDYTDKIDSIAELLNNLGMENRIEEYLTREGDYLLLTLLRLNPKAMVKTYYLTANTKDDLRFSSELKAFMDVGQFSKEHIIEKGSSAETQISDILSNLKTFKIQNNYRKECDIIRKRLSEDDLFQFVEMIAFYESDKRRDFVNYLRKLLDNILHDIAFRIAEPNAGYWNPKNKKQLNIKPFIKGFTSGNHISGLPAFEDKHHIGYNSIIRNACLSIFEISSDCGIHDISKAIDIESLNTDSLSSNTMNSLLCQIRDVIVWYDKALALI
ncbi:MAG: hypothetical protein Q8M92_01060 [Candidatus Subteraquimicrobiales bacterium]|nr:hypothetical protein [Candidatus Subteraquimicrobiales bacterium]